MNLRGYAELLRLRREGASLGDIALLKFELLGGAPDDVNARLAAKGLGSFDVDMKALRALPDGTVGREFARLLDKNGLSPLVVSQAMKERFAGRPFAMRYTTTHDLFHVITGFPTTIAGEMGLLAFMIAQGFGGGHQTRLWLQTSFAALIFPLHVPGMWHNIKVGLAMGKKAKLLLEEPIEAWIGEPLDVVRDRLGLPDPVSAGIDPGHESLLAKWLVPKEAPKAAVSHV